MAQAKTGDKVKVHYKGTLDDGTVFDSSEGRDPLEFTVGSKQVIAGFDDAVEGLEVDSSVTVNIPCDKAYGPKRDDMLVELTREQFNSDVEPELGQRFQVQQPDGQVMVVTVAAVTEEKVTLDGNHPLAGKDLTFEIKLVEICE